MKEETAVKKKMNPMLWVLFAVIIPVSVLAVIAVIVLNFAGYDPVGWAKEKSSSVPILSSVLPEEKEEEKQTEDAAGGQAEADAKDEKIFDLQQTVNQLEEANEMLEREVIKLENRQQDETQDLDDSAAQEENGSPVDGIKESYEEMKPQQATRIISELDEETAVQILRELSNETTGGILAAMDPEVAAKYTKLLIEE